MGISNFMKFMKFVILSVYEKLIGMFIVKEFCIDELISSSLFRKREDEFKYEVVYDFLFYFFELIELFYEFLFLNFVFLFLS